MGLVEKSYTDEEDEEIIIIALAGVVCVIVENYYEKHMAKVPCTTSCYTGHQYVMEILDGHPMRCHELFRMEKHVFLRLIRELKDKNLLQDIRRVTVEEQLAIFLSTIGHNERNCKLQEDLQHSGETISRYFNDVLRAMATFSMSNIIHSSFDRTSSYIRENSRFCPHFKGCIGAIDGTSTGSAHDSRILREAFNHPTLNFPKAPNGNVDIGYPNMQGFLSPFKKHRYHNSAYQNSAQASGKEELFNRKHSSLRHVIERCFSVWKARCPILCCMASYPFDTQRLIVVASMAVHNFIRQETQFDTEFRRSEIEGGWGVEESDSDDDSSSDDEENEMDIVWIEIENSIQST